MRHPGDERSETDATGLARQTGQERPALERGSFGVAVERLEVVEDPHTVEPRLLRQPRAVEELVPRELVLRDVETQSHAESPLPIRERERSGA